MPKNNHRIILTGGPGSGKSTLINYLHKMGYFCSKEAGRSIIQDQTTIKGNALPWVDPIAFSEAMLTWELRSWHDAEKTTQPYFYDRGLPDIAGYLQLNGYSIPQPINNAITLFRYFTTVFIAPPWEDIYIQDNERKQSFKEAKETYHSMFRIYQEQRYHLVKLPNASVEQRAKFIISSLN